MFKSGIVYYLLLLVPFFVFYDLFKKHWQEKNIKRGFIIGFFAGIITVLFVRGAYFLINCLLGFELKNFISGNHAWWIILLTNICVVGFIEELFKAFGSSAAGLLNERGSGVAIIFMNYAGCALGFSFMENIQYVGIYGYDIVLSRILVSSVAHLFFSCLCSHTAILAKVRSSKFFISTRQNENSDLNVIKNRAASLFVSIGVMLGVLFAAIIHGTFNFFCFYFQVKASNGILLAILSLFVLIIHGWWIIALRLDMPDYLFISSCPKCGSVSFLPFKFCGTCGSRVNILRKFTFIVKEAPNPSLINENSDDKKTENNHSD